MSAYLIWTGVNARKWLVSAFVSLLSIQSASGRDAIKDRGNGRDSQVILQLVAVTSPSSSDVIADLPASLTSISVDESFFVELWATTTEPSGFAIVSADVLFDPDVLQVVGVTQTALFDALPLQVVIDNVGGLLDNLSGAAEPSGCSAQVGFGEWVRVAEIEMQAQVTALLSIGLVASESQVYVVAICGMGTPPTVEYRGIGGALEPPVRAPAPHDILKNRYISIDPRGVGGGNPGAHHIRVEVRSSLVNGLVGSGPWWATAPIATDSANCLSVLQVTKPASEPDWTGCPIVHLTGCPIVPTTSYGLRSEAGGELSADESVLATQAKPGAKWYGDAVGPFDGVSWGPPNGVTNIDDAVAAIKTFQDPLASNATHTSVTDVHPSGIGTQINLTINFDDVFQFVLAFQGEEYTGVDLTQCP